MRRKIKEKAKQMEQRPAQLKMNIYIQCTHIWRQVGRVWSEGKRESTKINK